MGGTGASAGCRGRGPWPPPALERTTRPYTRTSSPAGVCPTRGASVLGGGPRLLGEQAVSVDDGGREVDQLAVVDARALAQHLERAGLVDGVALHQDALRALGQRATPERPLELVELGEAAQHDVDRALPILDVGIADVREDAP